MSCVRDEECACAGWAIGLVAEKPLVCLDRPVRILVGVAAVAGIWNAEFLSEFRIWNAETVIMAWVTLHVGRDRHVAGYALIAGAVGAVMAMCGGFNDGCGREVATSACVAVHAELVAHGNELIGVWVMTIRTTNSCVLHTT